MQDHRQYLLKALALAATRKGFCAPNPAVGALIVKGCEIIAEGVHYACGEPHAEVMALRGYQGDLSQATLYITLEPCNHDGRTPPCTEAILASGLHHVIYAYKDPNPLVAGLGHQRLLDLGIDIQHIDCSEINQFYQSYRYWHSTQLPWVTAKIAMSLDGKIAGPAGERIAITGNALRQRTYSYRLHSDAILTTAKTIIQDDPSLNIIINKNDEKQNVKDDIESNLLDSLEAISKPLYIIDRQLQLTSRFQIWKNNQPITVFYSAKNSGKISADLVGQGVRFIPIDEHHDSLDLNAILQVIGRDGIHDLWVEAGGRLLKSFIENKTVQKLLVYCSPKWLGNQAQSAFNEGKFLFDQFAHKQWHSVGDEAILEMTAA